MACHFGETDICGFGDGPGDGGGDPGLDIIAWVIGLVNAVVTFFVNVIRALISILVVIFKAVGKFLLHIWTRYIPRAINFLARHAQKLREWLKRTLKPIIARLEKIKKWYDEHILKQQLRLIQMIQRIRQFLGILRVLHIKWASTLDNALADIQNRIEKNIALVRGTLNQIINTLTLMMDPTLLIRRNVLGGTLLSNLGALRRVFGFYHHGPFTEKEATYVENNVGRYQASTAGSHIATLASSGLTDYDMSELTDARAGISAVTGIPTGL